MRRILILTLVLAYASSCNKKELAKSKGLVTSEDQLIPLEDVSLFGKKIKLPDSLTLGANNLLLLDGYLVVCKSVGTPYYYELFDLQSGKHIRSFCGTGQGPGEFAGVAIEKINDTKTMGINARQMGGMYFEVNIDSLIGRKDYFPKHKFDFNYKVNNHFVAFKDFFVTLSLHLDRIALVDREGEVISQHFSYPFEEELSHIAKDVLGMAYQGALVKSDSLNRVAVFNDASPNWDIFEVADSQSVIEINKTHLRPPKVKDETVRDGNVTSYSVSYSRDNVRAFTHVKSTNKYIYALYSGKSYRDKDVFSDFGNNLIIIDWEGNLLAKHLLDREIAGFVVTPDNKRLIAVTEDINENSIYEYDLPIISD